MQRRRTEDYQSEVYTVEIKRHLASGSVVEEVWRNQAGEIHRPLNDGPAIMFRNEITHTISHAWYVLHGREFDPATGESKDLVRAPRKRRPFHPSTPEHLQMTRRELMEIEAETFTVRVQRHLASGIARFEWWYNQKGEVHRPLSDGPAKIDRSVERSTVDDVAYFLENAEVNRATGEVIRVLYPGRSHKPHKRRIPQPAPE